MSKTLASYWRFLLAGLLNQGQTGAVLPSQRFLVDKMIAPIPEDYSEPIVELGPGTGVLTRRLASRCPRAPIVACEINPILARDLEYNLARSGLSQRVRVVCDSAEHLLASLARQGEKARFVLSGIPLGNLPRQQVLALLGNIRRALAQGGMYIQYQHSLLDRKKIKAQFRLLRTAPVFINFPPAVVYYAVK
jgi:phosphatidylethanolamine/phosphatidyl-N-methylethanolamine N-methyltransferase